MGDYDILVKISGDASSLISAIGAAGKNVTDFTKGIDKIGKTLTVVGGAITAAFATIIYKTVEAGDQIWDMSQRTGIAVETLSALGYAAKQSGTDMETVETSLKFLARAMDDMAKGTGTAKDTFAQLGVAVKGSEGKLRPTVEVMKDVATAISKMTNETQQTVVATELFGSRMGTQLLPMLKLGGNEIENLMNKAKELNIVFTEEDAKAADNFKDKMNDLKEVLGAAARSLANVLIPTLMEYANKAVEIVKKIREWADSHKSLVEMIIKVGATLGVLAAAGGPILLAVSTFLKLAPAIEAVKTALLSLATGGTYGLVIAAVAAFVIAYKNNFLGLKTFADNLWEHLKAGYKDYAKFIYDIEANIGAALITPAMAAAESAKNIALFSKSTEELLKKTNEVIPTLQKLSVGGFATVGLGVKAAINDFGSFSKALKEKFTDAFIDAMKTVEDRLFELTHTKREIEIKGLDEKKAKLIEIAKQAGLSAKEEIAAIKEIMDWYRREIDLLNKKETTLTKKYYDIYTKAGEKIGVMASAALAEEYMAEGYNIKPSPYNPAEIIPGQLLPELQTGTPLVTKTGLAVIDKGEAVLTPQQNKAYQSGGKTEINININNPIVRNDDDIVKIRREVNKAIEEAIRQYGRSGYVMAY